MEDKTSEKGEKSPIREVGLNQEFSLFDPIHTLSKPGLLYDADKPV